MASSLTAQQVWQSPSGEDFLHFNNPSGGGVLSYIDSTGTFNGPVSGAITGNITGNVTGNVTGNTSGFVTASAGVAATPSIFINAGVAPTTPAAGAVWIDSQGVPSFSEVSGSTIRVSGALTVLNAQAPLTAVTTAQNLLSFSLPAGLLNVAAKTLRISGTGIFTNSSGSTANVTIASSVAAVSTSTVSTGATVVTGITNGQFEFDIMLQTATTGATGAINGHQTQSFQIATTLGSALAYYADQLTGNSSSVNLTTADTLLVTIASTQSLASVTLLQGLIEILN